MTTAAHLVRGAEGIGVQFPGGRTVGARVVASELAADLSLIQLDQVPADLRERTSRLASAAPVAVMVLRASRPLKLTGKMP